MGRLISRLRSRMQKGLAFADSRPVENSVLCPWPWKEPGRPYFLRRPTTNPDGFGGYTRLCRFDEDGMPYLPAENGRRYQPTTAARFAMRMLAVAEATGNPEPERHARRVLPFLIRSGNRNGAWGDGPAPDRMEAELPSCHTQGVVLSAILRLVEGRPQPECRTLLERACDRLLAPAQKGGTVFSLAEGPFLEEYLRPCPSHVLNGCCYGLFALYDLSDALAFAPAAEAASRIETTLTRLLPRYTTRLGWSLYSLNSHGRPLLASVAYHRSHILLARVIALRTGNEELADAAARWEGALLSTRARLLAGAAKAAQVLWVREIRRVPLHEG